MLNGIPLNATQGRKKARKTDAEADVDSALSDKPQLLVRSSDKPATAEMLGSVLTALGNVFVRGGVPVKLVPGDDGTGLKVMELSAKGIVGAVRKTHQPVEYVKGKVVEITLPVLVAEFYLASGELNLPPLAGFAHAPILTATGEIASRMGYDPPSQLWRIGTPDFHLPAHPTPEEAAAALLFLRELIATFPFADSPRVMVDGVSRVDTSQPPGADESAFLVAWATAVMRPNLPLAPGLLLTAPPISGAGTGKGLAARLICRSAYGTSPRAVVTGSDAKEMEQRIGTQFLDGRPVVYLDNLNNRTLKSDQLASALTENPCDVRPLGHSRMLSMHVKAFVVVTGNGLRVSEDLLRRFIHVRFDAREEHPESRDFLNDPGDDALRYRDRILAAIHTIIRWGRQTRADLRKGKAFGSYPDWCATVRDPFLALGCRDPVEAAQEAKQDDPLRQQNVERLMKWWECHEDNPVRKDDLDDELLDLFKPPGQVSPQGITAMIEGLVGVRVGGFTLTKLPKNSNWGKVYYQLQRTGDNAGAPHPAPTPREAPRHRPSVAEYRARRRGAKDGDEGRNPALPDKDLQRRKHEEQVEKYRLLAAKNREGGAGKL